MPLNVFPGDPHQRTLSLYRDLCLKGEGVTNKSEIKLLSKKYEIDETGKSMISHMDEEHMKEIYTYLRKTQRNQI